MLCYVEGLKCKLPTKLIIEVTRVQKEEGAGNGGDNSKKACFGRTTKVLREYGNFDGNREARKNFRET